MSEKNMSNAANNAPGMSMGGAEKSKNFKKAFARFFQYISRYKVSIILAGVLSIAGALLNLIGPSWLSKMTNLITEGLSGTIDLAAISRIGLLLGLMYVLGFVFNYIQGWIMAGVSQKVTYDMREDISQKLSRLPLKFFDSTTTGDILSRSANDVDTVGQTMNQSLSSLISSAAMFLGSAILMFATNWIMAAAGIISALAGFIIMMAIIGKSQKYFTMQQEELGGLNGLVEESCSGLQAIQSSNAQGEFKNRFARQNEDLYVCAWKSQFLSGLMMPMMMFIGNLAYVVVCIVGAVLAVRGTITFGTIVAFMLYIRLFTQPLQNISQAISSLQSMAAACERVFEFMDEEEMEDESAKTASLLPVHGDVSFDHVKFGYDENKPIIHDFNEQVKAGNKIAIVGPTGAGKTTLVNLLMRFYETNDGSISIDDTNIHDVTRENLHDAFGMVLQDTWLFEGTLRENLVFSQEGITDEQLDAVCEKCGLTDLKNQLSDGYDTMLGDNASLSAGQKQLITIARVMLKDSSLLILDEATSNVDTRTEQIVQQAMDALMEGKTSFVIAHRLSTIKNADCIFVLNHGDIVESGSHEELLAKNGFYASLYNSQFEAA